MLLRALRSRALPSLVVAALALLSAPLQQALGDSSSPECRAVMQECDADGKCPDLTIDGPTAQSSLEIKNEIFGVDSCAVYEGCTQVGQRKVIRFDLGTPNIGTKDLIVGNPSAPMYEPCFVWSACHNHYHFTGYATYELRRLDQPDILAVGAKASSCLQDAYRWPPSTAPVLPSDQWSTCANQAIHMGYQDLYGGHLDCQWVDVTGLTPGTYSLRVAINQGKVLKESNYSNNEIIFPVLVEADDAYAPPADPTTCAGYGGCQSCTAAPGCGWCSSGGYCGFGGYSGPASGRCSAWAWGTQFCSRDVNLNPTFDCEANTDCGSCMTAEGCGWCASSKTCAKGNAAGPSAGSCSAAWRFGSSTQCDTCAEQPNCQNCTNTPDCGWCKTGATTGTCTYGNFQGSYSATCGDLWKWGAAQCVEQPPKACNGSDLTLALNNDFGTCPKAGETLASGGTCQLSCKAGYNANQNQAGVASCSNGVWSVTNLDCRALSCVIPPTPEGAILNCAAGLTIQSGASFTYGRKWGYTLKSGSMTQVCQAGSFSTLPPVLVKNSGSVSASTASYQRQPALNTATMAARNRRDEMHAMAVAEQVAGQVRQMKTFTAEEQTPEQKAAAVAAKNAVCSAHTSCGTCASASGCGWCARTNSCTSGGWAGSADATCSVETEEWKWSLASCVNHKDATNQAACAIAQSCSTCAVQRGCGWCATTGRCSAGSHNAPLRLGEPEGCPAEGAWKWSVRSCVSDKPSTPQEVLASKELGHLTLDQALKADPVGNVLKERDSIGHGFKQDAAGNFLKMRQDVDLAKVEAPPAAAHHVAGRMSRAAHVADVLPMPLIDRRDPDPFNADAPHGHMEHVHSHMAPAAAAATATEEGTLGVRNAAVRNEANSAHAMGTMSSAAAAAEQPLLSATARAAARAAAVPSARSEAVSPLAQEAHRAMTVQAASLCDGVDELPPVILSSTAQAASSSSTGAKAAKSSSSTGGAAKVSSSSSTGAAAPAGTSSSSSGADAAVTVPRVNVTLLSSGAHGNAVVSVATLLLAAAMGAIAATRM